MSTRRGTSASASSPTTAGDAGVGGGKRGLSRIGAVRKLVSGIIKRSRLEIVSLHISSPDATGLCARGRVRLSHLGSGPVPLVGIKVAFRDRHGATLGWARAPVGESDAAREEALVRVQIEPLTLQAGSPGSASAEVDMRLILLDDSHDAFVRFVRYLVRSPASSASNIALHAQGVEVRAFGLTFGGLNIDKIVTIGGLGCLGGALIFDDNDGEEEEEWEALQQGRAGMLGKRAGEQGKSGNEALASGQDGGKFESKTWKKRWRMSLGSRRNKSASASSMASTSSRTVVEDDKKPEKKGHQGLAKPKTTGKRLDISGLEIVGGHPQRGIEVKAMVTLENPSTKPAVTIQPGDLRFVLCVVDQQATTTLDDKTRNPAIPRGLFELGSLSLASVTLSPGPNHVEATGTIAMPAPVPEGTDPSSYAARAHKAGQRTLASILQNEALDACAISTNYDAADPSAGASAVGWLAEAFQGARIDARIPPLGDRARLLDGAEVRVEGSESAPSTPLPRQRASSGSSTNPFNRHMDAAAEPDFQKSVARTTLRNGFGADVQVSALSVHVRSNDFVNDEGEPDQLTLGKVVTPSAWPGMVLSKGGQPTHVTLPFDLNPDPKVLVDILRRAAKSRGVQLGDALTSLLDDMQDDVGLKRSRPASSIAASKRTSIADANDPSADLASLLARALANLRVTAHVEAQASLGAYKIPGKLSFVQRDLPIALSTTTAAALMPRVGKPFVKALVDRGELELESVYVLSMSDRGVMARVALRLKNFGPLSAQVDFVDGLEVYSDDGTGAKKRKVAVLFFEEPLSVIAGQDDAREVTTRIAMPPGQDSIGAFSAFVSGLINERLASYAIKTTNFDVTSGGVHFASSIEKKIEIPGLGGLPSLSISDFKVVGEASAPAEGISLSVAAPAHESALPTALQISAKASIVNESNLSLHLERLECALVYEGATIGQIAMEKVALDAQAECKVEAAGLIYAPERAGEEREKVLSKLGKLIGEMIAGRSIQVTIRGQRAWVAHGSSKPVSLSWLDEALRTLEAEATIPWPEPMRIIDEVSVGSLEAIFPARKAMQIKLDHLVAAYTVPFPISLNIIDVAADIEIMYEDKVVGRCSVKQDVMHESQETSGQPKTMQRPAGNASGRIKLSLQTFDLNTDDVELMGPLVTHAIESGPDGTNKMSLRGIAHVTIKTALGEAKVDVHLGKEHPIALPGLDGLRTSPFQITNLDIVGSTKDYILLRLCLYLNNPSDSVRARLPDSSLTMAAYYQDAYLGDVALGTKGQGVNFNSGPIAIKDVEFRYRPSRASEPRARNMLSAFVSGKTSQLEIRGHDKSSVNRALSLAVQQLRLNVDVKPLIHNTLLESISVQLGMSVVTSNSIDAYYIFVNPLPLPIHVVRLDVAAYYRSKPFGHATKVYRDPPSSVSSASSQQPMLSFPAAQAPGQPSKQRGDLVVKLSQPLPKLVEAFLHDRGSIALDVELDAQIYIGDYYVPHLPYRQRVPLHVTGLEGVAKLLKLL